MSSDPLQQFVAHTRAELARAGLERVEFQGNVYWRGGQAPSPVLVLLHGVNDQAGTWAPVVPKLAAKYRLIIPDLPGHGESGPAAGPLPFSMMVRQLHAILQHEGVTCATLAGNSMGGWISLLYTFEHPDRVERLVLEDASGMMWPLSVPLVARDREGAITMLRAVHGPHADIPEWAIDALLKSAGNSNMDRVAAGGVLEYLVDAKLPSLNTPATLVWGADDGVLPVAYAEALQKKIAGSTLIVIDGAAHIPHRQQPERFIECLSRSFSQSGRD